MPLRNFLIPRFIEMVIKSEKETGQEQKVVEFLTDLLEKNPHAKQLWGAIKKLSKDEIKQENSEINGNKK